MPPTIILIRHAEAEHIQPQNWSLPDPPLTSRGFNQQCAELSKVLQNDYPVAQKIDLIVASPMRRTLQTTQQALGWLMDRGVPVILRAEWQENSTKPCDTGSPIPVMAKEWPQFDWDAVDPAYPSKEGLYEFSRSGLKERGRVVRKWLRGRNEKVIAVVSHAGFLRVGVSYSRYANADFRIFEFDEKEEDKLVEWEETEKNGGGLGKSERGYFPMQESDNIPASEITKDAAVGEAVSEEPSSSL